jgi:nicotinate-nucleotide adenylyltransferase
VIGTDALALLPRWRDAARIPALARIVAVGRPGAAADLGALIAALPGLAERLTRLDGPDLAISSSALRRRVAAGLPIRYLVPDAVAAYIAGHGLYRDA